MADSSAVDRVADAMMARYPGWVATPEQRARMRAAIEEAPSLTAAEAVKVGRLLSSSAWWKMQFAHGASENYTI